MKVNVKKGKNLNKMQKPGTILIKFCIYLVDHNTNLIAKFN